MSDASPYRTCRRCGERNPLDTVHYHVYCTSPQRWHTACSACEIALAALRHADTVPDAPARKAPKPPIPLTMGTDLHKYAVRGGESKRERHAGNPTGVNGTTPATTAVQYATLDYQQLTLRTWLAACEMFAGDDVALDTLWTHYPHEEDWRDPTYHASFVAWCRSVMA